MSWFRRLTRWFYGLNKPGVEGSLADLARDIYEHDVRPHQKNGHRAVIGLEVKEEALGAHLGTYLVIDGVRYELATSALRLGLDAFADLVYQIFDKLWYVLVDAEDITLTGELHR